MLRVVGYKQMSHHGKNTANVRFSITLIWVGITDGVNVPVVLLESVKSIYQSLFGDVFQRIMDLMKNIKKTSLMYDVTQAKLVEILAPHIQKMTGSVFCFVIQYKPPPTTQETHCSLSRIFHYGGAVFYMMVSR